MKDFNYQEQLLLWKKNQLLLQKKYADTPPGFSSAEAEKAAWAAWEEDTHAFRNTCTSKSTIPLCLPFPPL